MNEITKETIKKRGSIIIRNPESNLVRELIELGYTITAMRCIDDNYTYFLRRDNTETHK